MKTNIALVHDHLTQSGGAERVLQVLQGMFPQAPTYTTVLNKENVDPAFSKGDIRPSFIQHMPFGVKRYQWYLPFMPAAFEQFDFSPYQLVISSCSGLAKGIITPKSTSHVCYCYTPTRYLWSDRHTYVESRKMPRTMKSLVYAYLSYLRNWDYMAAQRVDHFIAISHTVKKRIKEYYNRDSEVIFPPVRVQAFAAGQGNGGYYLTGGRLTYYKRFDITVDAFSKLNIPLYVYGVGPELKRLQARARDNVHFLGRVSEERLKQLYAEAIAFINPQIEDFGITMVESLASGRPVIAYDAGGARDIIEEGVSGQFFDEQSWESLADIVMRFEPSAYNPETIREHALRFSEESFTKSIMSFLSSKKLTE